MTVKEKELMKTKNLEPNTQKETLTVIRTGCVAVFLSSSIQFPDRTYVHPFQLYRILIPQKGSSNNKNFGRGFRPFKVVVYTSLGVRNCTVLKDLLLYSLYLDTKL